MELNQDMYKHNQCVQVDSKLYASSQAKYKSGHVIPCEYPYCSWPYCLSSSCEASCSAHMQHVAHVYMSGHVHVQTHNVMYTTCNVLCMYYTHMHFFPKTHG